MESTQTDESTDAGRFDRLAKEWDVAPMHLDRTRDVANLMRHKLALSGREALEVGAGTGLLSFALAANLGRILATDPSAGMVDVLKGKIERSGIGNIKALRTDDSLEGVAGPFDLVMSQMALHHIKDVDMFLRRALTMIRQGGDIAIADLDTEDGSFHGGEVTDVHHGFDREDLGRRLASAGFEDIAFETVHVMKRPVGEAMVDFPIFLCVAKVPQSL
ncbi:MAG: methyltransferase domain-containing protein [Fibrobacteres bacterium]|nr:methyltransferase domain-containing protein [Fibrobacterota bacterium]